MLALELRLGAGSDERSPRADLSARLGSPASLLGLPPTLRLPAPLRARLASEERPAWPPGIEAVWLAFDAPRTAPPLPAVYAALSHRRLSTDELEETLELIGSDAPSQQVICCFETIRSAGGRLSYLGCMAPRAGRPLRVEVFGLKLPEIVLLLARLGANDGARRLREHTELLSGAGRLGLAFDWIEERVGPRLGIEASFRHVPTREPGWHRLFDRLVDRGLCTEAQRRDALAWTGSQKLDREIADRHDLPRELTHLARALSHVKLVLEPRAPATAKLYLLLTPWPES